MTKVKDLLTPLTPDDQPGYFQCDDNRRNAAVFARNRICPVRIKLPDGRSVLVIHEINANRENA